MQEINGSKQESSARSVLNLLRSRARKRLPLLVVLSGPSHAGKSTFAGRLSRQFRVISSDEIRKRLGRSFENSGREMEVWNLFESMKRKALSEGRNIILDACHISKRARWHALQGPNNHHKKICVVFDMPFLTVRERCMKEKRVSLKEVVRMWKALQDNKPTIEELKVEGFDDVCFIRERHVSDMQSAWPQREAHEMKAICSALCHKADRLMSAASSILLWAPTPLCVHACVAPVFGALWQSPRRAGCGKPNVERDCPRHPQAGWLYVSSSSRQVVARAMPVANAMKERHLALFNRYLFEPAINLLYAPTCGRSGNRLNSPGVKSAVRAGIGGAFLAVRAQ